MPQKQRFLLIFILWSCILFFVYETQLWMFLIHVHILKKPKKDVKAASQERKKYTSDAAV